MSPVPHFRIPLNLPHAGTVSKRILFHLAESPALEPAREAAGRLAALLAPFTASGENPAPDEAGVIVPQAAALGREVVQAIEKSRAGHDRLGQALRNLFECLELGEEGAAISLRAGESPGSALRPT